MLVHHTNMDLRVAGAIYPFTNENIKKEYCFIQTQDIALGQNIHPLLTIPCDDLIGESNELASDLTSRMRRKYN